MALGKSFQLNIYYIYQELSEYWAGLHNRDYKPKYYLSIFILDYGKPHQL